MHSLKRIHLTSLLDVVATAAVVVALGVFLLGHFRVSPRRQSPGVPVPVDPVSLDGAQTEGVSTAPVALVGYSDFQCPFCRRFAVETLPRLRRVYVATGRLVLAFRHLPLSIHEHAVEQSRAAACAGEQNMFWPMHDLLFTRPVESFPSGLEAAAGSLGLSPGRFQACVTDDNGRSAQAITNDVASAKNLGITGTPTFLVGDVIGPNRVHVSSVIAGARPWADFERSIERALSERAPVRGN